MKVRVATRCDRATLPVDIAPMSDLHDDHDQGVIHNLICDTIHTLADTIPILARQLFTARGPRFNAESTNPANEPPTDVPLRDGVKFLECGSPYFNFIACHGS